MPVSQLAFQFLLSQLGRVGSEEVNGIVVAFKILQSLLEETFCGLGPGTLLSLLSSVCGQCHLNLGCPDRYTLKKHHYQTPVTKRGHAGNYRGYELSFLHPRLRGKATGIEFQEHPRSHPQGAMFSS